MAEITKQKHCVWAFVLEIIRVPGRRRACPPPESGRSSPFQGRGLKRLVAFPLNSQHLPLLKLLEEMDRRNKEIRH